MTFTATHARAFVGSDITVTVVAGETESIANVTINLDGFLLEELVLTTGTEKYERAFSGVGSSAPRAEHALIVTAQDGGGVAHSATTRWTDS